MSAASLNPTRVRSKLILLGLSLAVLLQACGNGNGSDQINGSDGGQDAQSAAITKVEVTPAQATIAVGQTLQLTAVAMDANGQQMTNAALSWSSSDDAVATVDGAGLVTGIAPGSAQINAASDSGVSGSAAIQVQWEGPLLELKIRGIGGRVTSIPSGIQCTSSCSVSFEAGSVVTLVTQTQPGYVFGGWLGDCEGWEDCQVVMDGPRAVTATFFLEDPPWDASVGAADCQAAWGAAGEKLSPCDEVPGDYVVVRKSARNLAVCNQGNVTDNIRIGLGFGPVGDKERQGDGKTPEGVFYISRLVPESDWTLAFLISYPDKQDAARGLAAGLIDADEKAAIDAAQDSCDEPPSSTDLGGVIEIHGSGGYPDFTSDWTAGCVGISDAKINELWSILDLRDTVVILP